MTQLALVLMAIAVVGLVSWLWSRRLGLGIIGAILALCLAAYLNWLGWEVPVWAGIGFLVAALIRAASVRVGSALMSLGIAISLVIFAVSGLFAIFPGAKQAWDENWRNAVQGNISLPNGCPPEFVQTGVSHENYRLVDDFRQYVEDQKGTGKAIPDAYRAAVQTVTGADAGVLASFAHEFKLWEDTKNTGPLVSGNCLSEQGQELQQDVLVILKASTIEEVQSIDPNRYNSSYIDGIMGTAAEAGLTGDLFGYRVTLPNGTTYEALARCHNFTYASKPPGRPDTPTDNPPVDTPHEDTPPPVTHVPDDSKHGEDSVEPVEGVTTGLGTGTRTTDRVSEDQHTANEVEGNIADNGTVAGTTDHGDTTAELGTGTSVGGAVEQTEDEVADEVADDVTDEDATIDDDGGTEGATSIGGPPED